MLSSQCWLNLVQTAIYNSPVWLLPTLICICDIPAKLQSSERLLTSLPLFHAGSSGGILLLLPFLSGEFFHLSSLGHMLTFSQIEVFFPVSVSSTIFFIFSYDTYYIETYKICSFLISMVLACINFINSLLTKFLVRSTCISLRLGSTCVMLGT